jgi:hypothetical protein
LKLDAMYPNMLVGNPDPSMVLSTDDWIKNELVDDNITEADVELNRENIEMWLQHKRDDRHATSVLEKMAGPEIPDEMRLSTPKPSSRPNPVSTEVMSVGVVNALRQSPSTSYNVASDKQGSPGTSSGSRPNEPGINTTTVTPAMSAINQKTKDMAIGTKPALNNLSFNSTPDTTGDPLTKGFADIDVGVMKVPSVESTPEVDFELDLSTITVRETLDCIGLCNNALQEESELRPPVVSGKTLQFRLSARSELNKGAQVTLVMACVPLPLTYKEISTGTLKRVRIVRWAGGSLGTIKETEVIEIRTKKDRIFEIFPTEDLGGQKQFLIPLKVIFEVGKVVFSLSGSSPL